MADVWQFALTDEKVKNPTDFSIEENDKKDSKKYTRATGLGWINLLICPHYNAETRRQRWTKKIMKRTFKVPCIALDNCTAIEKDHKQKIENRGSHNSIFPHKDWG